ncbi:hypothetical protein MRB53_002173 [Persea americana]|uniref:Uncharacterized protein n=1 Tax=Persea americana TaxID=3435 RepID=A0ACC2MTT0_PERAE|nr:hypothetical protein MRB53_002173 [Persea americana]
MPSAKAILSTAGSLAASVVLIRTIANDLIPHQFQDYLLSTFHTLFSRFSSQLTIIIDEFDGFSTNQIYEAAEIYLTSKISPKTRRLKVAKSEKEENFRVTMERDEEIVDTFQGIQLRWRMVCHEVQRAILSYSRDPNSTVQSQVRYFELSFHKQHKNMVLKSYLEFVIREAKEMKENLKTVKLHTVQYENLYGNLMDAWSSVNLNHPAKFDTLAMDPELKKAVIEDLERFLERKEFYRRVGKAWKRGYLLYGPPGTGKSSLIAAIANFLKFSVYDLELTELRCNSELKKLIIATANRSIIVIEDIDCTIDLVNREKQGGGSQQAPEYNGQPAQPQVTLSGLLNFVDGLWSSCGDERIIIFTTNHKERLDPALLRPGRMDMHIHMSYLKASAFGVLASNHLGIEDHQLFEEIRRLLTEVEVTPAEVAEELMKSDNPDVALRGVIEFLQRKKRERDEAGTKQENHMPGQNGNDKKDEEQMGQQNQEAGEMNEAQPKRDEEAV